MKSLVVYTQNGLANRLRALASASILAEYTGRSLLLNWVPSRECNAAWKELFLNQFESCQLPLSNFRVGFDLYDDSMIPLAWYRDYPRLSIPGESRVFALHTCRNFQPEGMTDKAYQHAKSLFYRSLRPVDTVQKTVNDMQRRYFDGHDVIGVHIRRKDHLNFIKKDHRLVCPTSMFAGAIENILRDKPEAKIFLATDDRKEEKLISQSFPGAIIVYEKEEVRRDTTKGIQDALIDWLLLSKTSRIIVSYASSFSEEAGAVNRIKTDVVLREKELSRVHLRIISSELFKTHYRILKTEGFGKYFLYFYNYRKRQISNWRRKTSDLDNDI